MIAAIPISLFALIAVGATCALLLVVFVAWFRSRYRLRVRPYRCLPQFRNYCLEDGWLLGVREESNIVEFTVDAALTRTHPRVQPYRCWRKILITFSNVRSVNWVERNLRPNVDLDGSIDYGSIDCFDIETDKYHLSGQWGEIEIVSGPVKVSELEHQTTDAWGGGP